MQRLGIEMDTLEDMAREINRLNVALAKLKLELAEHIQESEKIAVKNIELDHLIFGFKFRVDLDGDAVLYNRLISFSDPDFGILMDSIQRHKDRWGIKGDTF